MLWHQVSSGAMGTSVNQQGANSFEISRLKSSLLSGTAEVPRATPGRPGIGILYRSYVATDTFRGKWKDCCEKFDARLTSRAPIHGLLHKQYLTPTSNTPYIAKTSLFAFTIPSYDLFYHDTNFLSLLGEDRLCVELPCLHLISNLIRQPGLQLHLSTSLLAIRRRVEELQ